VPIIPAPVTTNAMEYASSPGGEPGGSGLISLPETVWWTRQNWVLQGEDGELRTLLQMDPGL